MTRQSWISFIPDEWNEREKNNQCPVCGTHKALFEKGMKKFCSEKCRNTYSEKLIFWDSLRYEALKRDNYTCQQCGINKEKAEKEWSENKEKYREANIDYVIKNGRILLEKEKERMEEDIQDYLAKIHDRLEKLSDERLLAKEVINFPQRFEEFQVIKLPYPEEFSRPIIPSMEVDHKIAITNGGDQWDLNNLQTLCHECHLKKTRKDMHERRLHKKGIKPLIEESTESE